MEISEEAKLDMKNALNGKLSDNYDELKIVLENLTAKKAVTTDHGSFKQIDKAIGKVQLKMNRLQP
ncbi:MAG TPA: hypothetical protein EYO75_00840 [Sulfurimonas sp.]|jgi:dihydroorotase|nr:MAG: hypothetical protein DSZ04_00935 [Sulfurimonas sp.]HIC11925.1 hypothetical protein [Sulfurimonas sp.]HIM76277.1 hypothetical protein [Campylobacterales bacterium]